jgi:hypothetical protein
LEDLSIEEMTSKLFIEECHNLNDINFHFDSKNEIKTRNIAVVLKGQLAIEEISQWYVSELTIINNTSIYQLNAIYNLNKLIIKSCSHLRAVSNLIIRDIIDIEDCGRLSELENIMFSTFIRLIELPKLRYVGIECCSPRTVDIQDCELLKLKLYGEDLENLTLINTNIILVVRLSPYARIKTLKSGYLPNLETKYIVQNNETVIPEAIELIDFEYKQRAMLHKIIFNVRNHLVKKYKNRIQNILDNPYCTICMENINVESRFISRCFHMFHLDCISSWVVEKNICPLCNQNCIFSKSELRSLF